MSCKLKIRLHKKLRQSIYLGLPLPRPTVLPLLLGVFFLSSTLRFAGVVDKTLKNPSNLPCVVPLLAFKSFLQPFLTLSSLNCLSPQRNFTKPSSSGSDHFNYKTQYFYKKKRIH